jgi:hypothetical protein
VSSASSPRECPRKHDMVPSRLQETRENPFVKAAGPQECTHSPGERGSNKPGEPDLILNFNRLHTPHVAPQFELPRPCSMQGQHSGSGDASCHREVSAKLYECHRRVRVFDRILDHACCLQPKPVGISRRPMLDVKKQQMLPWRNRDKSRKRA